MCTYFGTGGGGGGGGSGVVKHSMARKNTEINSKLIDSLSPLSHADNKMGGKKKRSNRMSRREYTERPRAVIKENAAKMLFPLAEVNIELQGVS